MAAADVLAFHETLSNWGRWGDDDQLGTLNLITPEVTAAAAATVRTGRTVSCARPLDTRAAADNPNPVAHHMIGTVTEGGGADYVALAPHGFATSHIDALCHIFWDGMLYNGYPAQTVTAHGATRLGIHHLHAGIVTRGVLLDIPARRGVEALEPGEPVFPEDLEDAEAQAGLRVRPGDALLVRTGRWRWREEHGPWDLGALAAGLDASCLPWLRQRDVATLGSDGVSDVLPSRVEGVVMPIHMVVIPAMGVHLMDNLDLDALAAACADERRWAFLLAVAPLVLRRGTASPVNPIAVF
jgi:kynurenine formamidase